VTSWRAQILRDDRVVGAGVVVDDTHVVTAGHLVATDNTAPFGVVVGFAESPETRVATLETIRFSSDDGVDVAVLRLDGPLPPGVVPAVLGPLPGSPRAARVYGNPASVESGVWAAVTVGFSGGPGGRWIQLDPAGAGARIGAGFSGAGVMSDDDGHVIGYLTASHVDGTAAWMTPWREVVAHWPPLERLLPPAATRRRGATPSAAAAAGDEPPVDEAYGRVSTRGFGDRPATKDALARAALVETLAELLLPAPDDAAWDTPGPTVIAVEGSWGTGKSSIIGMVRRRLDAPEPQPPAPLTRAERRAAREMRAWEADVALGAEPGTTRLLGRLLGRRRGPAPPAAPPVVTVEFNPWSFQTGEQVWAGLTDAVVRAADRVLFPDPRTRDRLRERWWFIRNVAELDRRRLRKKLRQGVLSPILRLAVFALPVPILAQFVKASGTLTALAWTAVGLLAAGLLHTAWRYLTRPAAALLPADLFTRPVATGAVAAEAAGSADAVLHDPYYRARSGFLYLVQHDVFGLLAEFERVGTRLVVCVDDLDRCSPRTTADIFEAINVFVGQMYPTIRFLVGVDAAAVAVHLDAAYEKLAAAHDRSGADPSLGWSYLRKIVQLPVLVPRAKGEHVGPVLDHLLGPVDTPRSAPDPATAAVGPATPPLPPPATGEPAPTPTPSAVVAALEAHPRVRQRLADRLEAQPDLSVREAKRILTVWQFYVRVLDKLAAGRVDVADARHLVVLAEIVARWPAWQRHLNRRQDDGRHPLDVLTEAADDDDRWQAATTALSGDTAPLRDLLRHYDGKAVAALADRLT